MAPGSALAALANGVEYAAIVEAVDRVVGFCKIGGTLTNIFCSDVEPCADPSAECAHGPAQGAPRHDAAVRLSHFNTFCPPPGGPPRAAPCFQRPPWKARHFGRRPGLGEACSTGSHPEEAA